MLRVTPIDLDLEQAYGWVVRTLIRTIFAFGTFVLTLPGGMNWKTVWLEPNPIILPSPGSYIEYVVKGIDGANNQADLTHNRYLKITSSDESIIGVDQESARLVAKAVGRVEIRVSFSECTSINLAAVNSK
jgi:hypothetical protein